MEQASPTRTELLAAVTARERALFTGLEQGLAAPRGPVEEPPLH